MGGFLRFCEESGTYKKRRSTDESSVERRPLSVSKNTYLIVSRMEVPMVPFGIAIPKFSAMEAPTAPKESVSSSLLALSHKSEEEPALWCDPSLYKSDRFHDRL